MLQRLRLLLRNLFRFPKKNQAKKRLALSQVLNTKQGRLVPSWAQFKQLPRLLSKGEQQIALIALAIVLVSGGILGWQFMSSSQTTVARAGGDYTEGLIGSPQLINPIYSTGSSVDSDLSNLIYSGLMRYDTKDGLTTDLAESYTINEEGTVYQFIIREDARWHDGETVTARDIAFTIAAIQNPDYLSSLAGVFSGVSVKVLEDGKTLELSREEAFAPFLSYLTVGVLPSHLWQNIAASSATTTELNLKPIGSGPFKFEKLTKDTNGIVKTYSLERHKDYHLGTPYINELHFKFYSTLIGAVEALRNNNVQGITYLPITDSEQFEKRSGLTVSSPSIPQYNAIFFNEDSEGVLSSDTVRTAISQAIDKQAVIDEALNGKASPVDSFILPGMLGENPDLETIGFDVEAAKLLLEEASWTIADGAEIRTKDDAALRFTLTVIESPELSAVAEVLKQQLLAIGIDMQIETVSGTIFQSDTLRDRSYEAVLSGELYAIDPDPYAFWHSSQIAFPNLNLSGFSNRAADTLIEQGRIETDPEARAENYSELQELVLEELPAIFLYQPQYLYPHTSKLNTASLEMIAESSHRFSNVHEWYIRVKRSFR